LTHFQTLPDQKQGAIVQHCHFPDPVLACAAMQIMNEVQQGEPVNQVPAAVWASRAMTLFSSGLCTPEKGDIGEIAAALYMLFCGDEIRKAKDPSLKTFSIPLQEWLEGMDATPIMRGGETHEKGKSVSFIQFCRSYIRLNPGQVATEVNFLEELHRGAYGIYMYPGAVACDLLAAVSCDSSSAVDLKRKAEDASLSSKDSEMEEECSEVGVVAAAQSKNFEVSSKDSEMEVECSEVGVVAAAQAKNFEALLVSVKNRQEFSCTDMGQALVTMIDQLLDAGLDRGVCLLILVGLTFDQHFSPDNVADSKAKVFSQIMLELEDKLQNTFISCYVVIVKKDDKYGIGEMLQCTTCPGGEHAEIYASHFSLVKLAEEKEVHKLLRSGKLRKPDKTKDEGLSYASRLLEALRGSPPKTQEYE
jgi:hypothetical protein